MHVRYRNKPIAKGLNLYNSFNFTMIKIKNAEPNFFCFVVILHEYF